VRIARVNVQAANPWSEATAHVIAHERGAMRKHVENAVRDLRRELLREIEQLAAEVKRLKARQERPSRAKGEFKFAGETGAGAGAGAGAEVEARAESFAVPRFLPLLRKTTIN
jgi:hypothetical protein